MVSPIHHTRPRDVTSAHIIGTVRGAADRAPQCGRVHDPVAHKGARGVGRSHLAQRKGVHTLPRIALNLREYHTPGTRRPGAE